MVFTSTCEARHPKTQALAAMYIFGFLPIQGTWVVSREGSVPNLEPGIPYTPSISPILRAGHITESHAIDIELVAGRVHLCVQERTVPRTRLFRVRRTSRGREMAHCQVSTKGYESQTHLHHKMVPISHIVYSPDFSGYFTQFYKVPFTSAPR